MQDAIVCDSQFRFLIFEILKYGCEIFHGLFFVARLTRAGYGRSGLRANCFLVRIRLGLHGLAGFCRRGGGFVFSVFSLSFVEQSYSRRNRCALGAATVNWICGLLAWSVGCAWIPAAGSLGAKNRHSRPFDYSNGPMQCQT